MGDLIDQIRQQIDNRLDELRPLVDEQRRLEAALQALGDVTAAAAVPSPPSPKRAKSRAPKAASAKARKRAPRGANRDAVLRAVSERQGGTSAELAAVSGVERNTLYALLARMVKSGELRTQELPTGRTGYVLGEPPTAVPSSGTAA